jgi:energy-coupling factor transporter transmembrane protein EcfT
MRASLHELWGCGHGPVMRAAPQTRLVAGAAVFAACMVSTGATLNGSLCSGVIGAAWLAACRPPWKVVRTSLLLGLALFLPYFLLLPLLPDAPSGAAESWGRALVVPWTILLRGLCGMLVCIATVASLSASDLREALLRLPVPGIVSAILLQIVHQTATLFYETRQVAAAMEVRGTSCGGVAAWRVLFSLPRVWLPRVIVRAERVGAAMELRGYCDGHRLSFQATALGLVDLVTLGAAVAALGIAITLCVLEAP